MRGVLFAKRAILRKLDPVGIVLFILHIIVVALLALGAGQSDADSHWNFSLNLQFKKHPSRVHSLYIVA